MSLSRWVASSRNGRHVATPEELRVASCVDEAIDRRVLVERAREVMARLPDSCRDAFVLRDLEEMTTSDVARTLGVSQTEAAVGLGVAQLLPAVAGLALGTVAGSVLFHVL